MGNLGNLDIVIYVPQFRKQDNFRRELFGASQMFTYNLRL